MASPLRPARIISTPRDPPHSHHLPPLSCFGVGCAGAMCSRWLCAFRLTQLRTEDSVVAAEGRWTRGAFPSGATRALHNTTKRTSSHSRAAAYSPLAPPHPLPRMQSTHHGAREDCLLPLCGRIPPLLPHPLPSAPLRPSPTPAGPPPRLHRMVTTLAFPPLLLRPLPDLLSLTRVSRPRCSSSRSPTSRSAALPTRHTKAATRSTPTTSSAWPLRRRSAAHAIPAPFCLNAHSLLSRDALTLLTCVYV